MNLREYVRRKYNNEGFKCLMSCEARAIGVPFPLQAGWADKYGEIEIEGAKLDALIVALSLSNRAAAARGLEVLGFDRKDACGPFARQARALSRKALKKKIKAQRAEEFLSMLRAKKDRPTHVSSAPSVKQKPAAQKKRVFINGIDAASPEFLQTYEWRNLRIKALIHYGRRCMCCGASPETGAVMNVDHIKPRKTHPHLALEFDNLQVLCHDCNHGKGNWTDADFREPMPDAETMKMIRAIANGNQ